MADYCGILPTASRSIELEAAPMMIDNDTLIDDYTSVASDLSLLTSYRSQGSEMFKKVAKGCTAYVTLEPCCHKLGCESGGLKKNTPPCATTLVSKKIHNMARHIYKCYVCLFK